MNILVTGGTGFIGSVLCEQLLKNRHQVFVLSRTPEKVKPPLQGIDSLDPSYDLQLDVVINLAGEPIADKRWSEEQKNRMRSSRIDTSQKLIYYFRNASRKPKVFISGSAIGYYGVAQCNDPIDELGMGDDSFSSQLCQEWEAVALEAKALGIRTCLLRTGIVLGDGGALKKMLPPFKLGLGGKIGTGSQWMSWIHLNDLIGIILHCMEYDSIEGAINGTAPNPVTNQGFTEGLGEALNRPTFFQIPAPLIKLLMGKMGEELLLAGKKVIPRKAVDTGYGFQFEQLEQALANLIGAEKV